MRRKQSGVVHTTVSFLFGLVVGVLFAALPATSSAQIKPRDLGRDYLVKLVMKDSSQFYGIVVTKPVPDRILFETRYGRLEIPLNDIDYGVDYRYHFVMYEDIRKDALANTANTEKQKLHRYLNQSILESASIVRTKNFDSYRGYRYNFDDTAHVILSTNWGELYFTYPELTSIENYDGKGMKREEFFTTAYLSVADPRPWSAYITPNALPFGEGKLSIANYLFASLQLNYGVTDWLSINGGGSFIPFLPNTVKVATGGLKITPTSGSHFNAAAGAQIVYSDVVKQTQFLFAYGTATYGTWESNISVIGGVSRKDETDTLGFKYSSTETVLSVQGAHRVGENLKLIGELFFISNFDIVPLITTIRYFENNFTIDIGVVFSLYKSGAARNTPTIAETVFGVEDFPVIPIFGASYHF